MISKILNKYANIITNSKIAKSFIWSFFGAAISKAFILLSYFFIGRLLGKAEFGEFSLVQNTFVTLAELSCLGLSITVIRFVSIYRDTQQDKANNIFKLSLLLSCFIGFIFAGVIYINAEDFSLLIFSNFQFVEYIKKASILILIGAVNNILLGALFGMEAFKSVAKLNIFTGVISLILISSLTYKYGINGSISALILIYILVLLYSLYLVYSANKDLLIFKNFNFFNEEKTFIYVFTLPAFLSSAMVGPINWVCNSVLVRASGGFSELGLFNAANQWKTLIMFIPSVLSKLLLPILSNTLTKSKESYYKLLKINVIISLIITVSLSLFIILFAPLLMSFFGKEFNSGSEILIFLVFSTIPIAINDVIGQAIASQNRMWSGFLMNLLWAVVLLTTFNFYLDEGALGLAKAYLISYLFHTVVQVFFVYRTLKNKT